MKKFATLGLAAGLGLILGTSSANAGAPHKKESTSDDLSAAAGELEVSSPIQERQGLKSFAVTDRVAGAKFKVYFDAASASAAKDSIPILASMYRDLSNFADISPDKVKWDDVLFARNSDGLVVANKPWDMDVDADGRLSEEGTRSLYVTIPHEQTHATQDRIQKIPRWYAEGQATWVGILATEKRAPESARAERDRLTAALKESTTPVALHSWGGLIVKKEAFIRQMTPEQRIKFEKDSILPLGGHWKFGPDDMISDESNTTARYAAAFKIFERIERESDRKALQAWFKAVREAKTPITNDVLVSLAMTHTKVDISNDIK